MRLTNDQKHVMLSRIQDKANKLRNDMVAKPQAAYDAWAQKLRAHVAAVVKAEASAFIKVNDDDEVALDRERVDELRANYERKHPSPPNPRSHRCEGVPTVEVRYAALNVSGDRWRTSITVPKKYQSEFEALATKLDNMVLTGDKSDELLQALAAFETAIR